MSGEHIKGPWRSGRNFQSIVADHDTGHDDPATLEAYGGHLVCESVKSPAIASLLIAAPDMLAALKAMQDDDVIRSVCKSPLWALMANAIEKAEGRA